jgi:hypothetical protein
MFLGYRPRWGLRYRDSGKHASYSADPRERDRASIECTLELLATGQGLVNSGGLEDHMAKDACGAAEARGATIGSPAAGK